MALFFFAAAAFLFSLASRVRGYRAEAEVGGGLSPILEDQCPPEHPGEEREEGRRGAGTDVAVQLVGGGGGGGRSFKVAVAVRRRRSPRGVVRQGEEEPVGEAVHNADGGGGRAGEVAVVLLGSAIVVARVEHFAQGPSEVGRRTMRLVVVVVVVFVLSEVVEVQAAGGCGLMDRVEYAVVIKVGQARGLVAATATATVTFVVEREYSFAATVLFVIRVSAAESTVHVVVITGSVPGHADGLGNCERLVEKHAARSGRFCLAIVVGSRVLGGQPSERLERHGARLRDAAGRGVAEPSHVRGRLHPDRRRRRRRRG
mmetsp:Transcript_8381/g.25338  ORF Transcript_8381/g.25338 Transcript_8381/m.25338 type:complete len:315 (+) Transcript_8381:1071-2015(+)